MSNTTLTAPDGGPVYCSPVSSMEIWLRFLKCAGQSIQLEDFVISTKNEAYTDIFDHYFSQADRRAVSIKVWERSSGDENNYMVFTARTTGSRLTIHEKRWS